MKVEKIHAKIILKSMNAIVSKWLFSQNSEI